VANGCIKESQVISEALGFKGIVCGAIHSCTLAAKLEVDLINVFHKINSLLLADIFVERAAKVVCNVILSVRESACAAKAVHNSARLAVNAGFDFDTVNGTFTLFQLVSGFENGNFQVIIFLYKLIGGEDSTGACANYNYVVKHIFSPICKSKFSKLRFFFAKAHSLVSCLHVFFIKNAILTESLEVGENRFNKECCFGVHNVCAAEPFEMCQRFILWVIGLVSCINSGCRQLITNAFHHIFVRHKRLNLAFPVKPIFGVVLISAFVVEPGFRVANVLS
jgi:hypothetical protein